MNGEMLSLVSDPLGQSAAGPARMKSTLFDKAEDYFTSQIQAKPEATAYRRRGELRMERAKIGFIFKVSFEKKVESSFTMNGGDIELAIADFSEAIRLDPNDVESLQCRAGLWLGKKETTRRSPTSIKPFASPLHIPLF